VVNGDGRILTGKPYVIVKVNGLRVGVIGAMTNSLPTLTTPALMGDWHDTPVVETVRKYATELRPQTDLLVILGHLGPDEEKALLADGAAPVIVSGHLHSNLPMALTDGGRVMVRMRGYGEELGRLELKVETKTKSVVSWEWKKIPVDSDKVAPAADVAALVKTWEDKVTAVVDRPMGVSKRRLTHAEVKVLLEDAMREVTGADFAYMNLGGVRDVLPEGPLQERAAWNIMPFDNRVVFGVFKGRALPEVIKEGKTIDPDKDYRLAVSDFTAANQRAAEQLNSTGLVFREDKGLLRDALIQLIRKRKVIE
jgi:5'-nucleotidase/UDP-sugar diphosphatase